MLNNGDRIMSPPPLFEETTETKQLSVFSGSFEGSNDHKFNSQEENYETTMDRSPSASSAKEDQRKLKALIKRITIIENVKLPLRVIITLLSVLFTLVFGLPVKVCGVSLYTIWLASHVFFYSCLSFVQHWILAPLVDECNIVSCRIEGQERYLSTHWSKRVLFWCFLLPYLLITAGAWKFLSYMNFQLAKEGTYEYRRQFGIGILLGVPLSLFSFYMLWPVNLLYIEPKGTKHEREQGNEHTDKRVGLEMNDLSRTEYEEKIKEIARLKTEISVKDALYSQLLHEVIRPKKEDIEENTRAQCPPIEEEGP